jgi:hypothetical protein
LETKVSEQQQIERLLHGSTWRRPMSSLNGAGYPRH